MNNKQMLTALQIEAGIKLYKVKFSEDGRFYTFKSFEDYNQHDFVAVTRLDDDFLGFAQVVCKADDFDIEGYEENLQWIITEVNDLQLIGNDLQEQDRKASKKLARGKVINAAKEYATSVGLEVGDLVPSKNSFLVEDKKDVE